MPTGNFNWSQQITCSICGYHDAHIHGGLSGRSFSCPFQENEWHWKVSLTNERRNEIWRLIGQKKRLSDDPAQVSSVRLELAREIEGLEADFAAISQKLEAEIIEAYRLAIPATEIREAAKRHLLEIEGVINLFERFKQALELNLTYAPNDQTPEPLRKLIDRFEGKLTDRQIDEEIQKLWEEHKELIREHRLKTD